MRLIPTCQQMAENTCNVNNAINKTVIPKQWTLKKFQKEFSPCCL